MNADPIDERACRVSLAVFDGPLDLLLTLIKEHELDIMTVPLATVAEQYLAYIRIMDAIDVELAAEYLVVAATLVFLKSKALLPPLPAEFETGEESAEAIEERLRERLIVYSRYRTAGEDLRSRLALAAAFYLREGGDPTSELVQRYRIPSDRLAAALLAALRATKSEKRHIVRERVSLLEQMDKVMRAVRAGGRASFFALCEDEDKPGVIVTFLAVLELIRRGRLRYEQGDACSDIVLFAAAEAESHAA